MQDTEDLPRTWNYRVVRKAQNDEFAPFYYQMYEVHYEGKEIVNWTAGPQDAFGESVEELTRDLEYMRKALSLPVLDGDDDMKEL